MPRLIWVFAGRTVTLLVLSCRSSNFNQNKSFSVSCKYIVSKKVTWQSYTNIDHILNAQITFKMRRCLRTHSSSFIKFFLDLSYTYMYLFWMRQSVVYGPVNSTYEFTRRIISHSSWSIRLWTKSKPTDSFKNLHWKYNNLLCLDLSRTVVNLLVQNIHDPSD